MLDSEGYQWDLGRRLAVFSHTQELALCTVNRLPSAEVKRYFGRGSFPRVVRRTLGRHPEVCPTEAARRADCAGKLRCSVALILTAVRRETRGALERLVRKALDIVDPDFAQLSGDLDLVAALKKQAECIVNVAAAVSSDVQPLGDVLLEVDRLQDLLLKAVRASATLAAKEARESFREWVTMAVAKGARLAHAWVRRQSGEECRSTPLVLDGVSFPSVDVVVDQRSNEWEKR